MPVLVNSVIQEAEPEALDLKPQKHGFSLFRLPEEVGPHVLNLRGTFTTSAALIAAVIVPLYYVFVRYANDVDFSDQVERYYTFFLAVEIMVFVGFGCLMTFLKRYSYTSIAFTFFLSALVMIEAILALGLFQQHIWGEHKNEIHTPHIRLDIPLMIEATFCAASAMIAMGAWLGKATPTQMLWLSFMLVIPYAMVQQMVFTAFEALDIGGSISIHVFGAYYGLAASYFISRNQELYTAENPKNRGSYYTDVFSMIGTLALWIFWPSFNGALASYSAEELLDVAPQQLSQQFYVIVNTVISLLGSCIATFAVSAGISNKFNIMHIQNASLAGGVAMGSASNLFITPGGALTVGLVAGSVSTLGFAFLTPLLERTIGLGDTCGIHNLHGMPGIIGGLVAAFASLGQSRAVILHAHSAQFGFQIAAIVCTVAAGVVCGAVAGWLVTSINLAGHSLSTPQLFDDGAIWEDVDIEALPRGWDGGSSVAGSVYRGGARSWADGSLHGTFANTAFPTGTSVHNGTENAPASRSPGRSHRASSNDASHPGSGSGVRVSVDATDASRGRTRPLHPLPLTAMQSGARAQGDAKPPAQV